MESRKKRNLGWYSNPGLGTIIPPLFYSFSRYKGEKKEEEEKIYAKSASLFFPCRRRWGSKSHLGTLGNLTASVFPVWEREFFPETERYQRSFWRRRLLRLLYAIMLIRQEYKKGFSWVFFVKEPNLGKRISHDFQIWHRLKIRIFAPRPRFWVSQKIIRNCDRKFAFRDFRGQLSREKGHKQVFRSYPSLCDTLKSLHQVWTLSRRNSLNASRNYDRDEIITRYNAC